MQKTRTDEHEVASYIPSDIIIGADLFTCTLCFKKNQRNWNEWDIRRKTEKTWQN